MSRSEKSKAPRVPPAQTSAHDIPAIGGSFMLQADGSVTPGDEATAERLKPADPANPIEPQPAAEET